MMTILSSSFIPRYLVNEKRPLFPGMNRPSTINIVIRFGEPLREAIGTRRVTLSLPGDATLADLLAYLARTYPGFETAFRGDDLGRNHPYILFLNGRPVTRPNYAQARLADGDAVHIVLPVVGGDHA
ncbi:MAG TPA: MoaD/ThiS family protein [Anaerolineae bacterium]|nr:MoaD/ThiS family protein [Anaerolineae bacterium]